MSQSKSFQRFEVYKKYLKSGTNGLQKIHIEPDMDEWCLMVRLGQQ